MKKNRIELRADLFREAEKHVAMLKRAGYKDATVAPEYCIANEIGEDRYYTYTISIYAGEKSADKPRNFFWSNVFCTFGYHSWSKWKSVDFGNGYIAPTRYCECCKLVDRSKVDWVGHRP